MVMRLETGAESVGNRTDCYLPVHRENTAKRHAKSEVCRKKHGNLCRIK